MRKVDPSIIGVDTFMKETVQAVKRFALEKIKLLGAEGTNVYLHLELSQKELL